MKWLWFAVFLSGLVVESVIRGPYALMKRRSRVKDRRVTPAEQVLLAGLWVSMLVLPGLHAVSGWLSFADYPTSWGGSVVLGLAGVVCLAAAVEVFRRSHRALGANWSGTLEIYESHALVTHGVYRFVRHPMYSSQLLYALAQALLIQNWIAGPAGFACFLGFYLLRVPREEQMMLDHFRERYAAYRARTGSVLPRLGQRALPPRLR